MEVETHEGNRSRENFTVNHILCYMYQLTTTQGKSSKCYVCYGGVVVTGPGIYVACPVIDMGMIYRCSVLHDCVRDKDMVLEQV